MQITGAGVGIRSSNEAVIGFSSSNEAVIGLSSSNEAVFGLSSPNEAVFGLSSSNEAVIGLSSSNEAVIGRSSSNEAVIGLSSSNEAVIELGIRAGITSTLRVLMFSFILLDQVGQVCSSKNTDLTVRSVHLKTPISLSGLFGNAGSVFPLINSGLKTSCCLLWLIWVFGYT
jgi:hypothetical protein